jgi:intracellular septation protein A
VAAAGLIGFLLIWTVFARAMQVTSATTFGRIPATSPVVSTVLTSAAVSLQYAVYAVAGVLTARVLPGMQIVRFLSANTLIVFLAHMPLIYAVSPTLYPHAPPGWIRITCNFGIHFVLLAVLSSAITRVIPVRNLGVWLERRVFGSSQIE